MQSGTYRSYVVFLSGMCFLWWEIRSYEDKLFYTHDDLDPYCLPSSDRNPNQLPWISVGSQWLKDVRGNLAVKSIL